MSSQPLDSPPPQEESPILAGGTLPAERQLYSDKFLTAATEGLGLLKEGFDKYLESAQKVHEGERDDKFRNRELQLEERKVALEEAKFQSQLAASSNGGSSTGVAAAPPPVRTPTQQSVVQQQGLPTAQPSSSVPNQAPDQQDATQATIASWLSLTQDKNTQVAKEVVAMACEANNKVLKLLIDATASRQGFASAAPADENSEVLAQTLEKNNRALKELAAIVCEANNKAIQLYMECCSSLQQPESSSQDLPTAQQGLSLHPVQPSQPNVYYVLSKCIENNQTVEKIAEVAESCHKREIDEKIARRKLEERKVTLEEAKHASSSSSDLVPVVDPGSNVPLAPTLAAQGSAPQGSAPQGSAPQGSAPQGSDGELKSLPFASENSGLFSSAAPVDGNPPGVSDSQGGSLGLEGSGEELKEPPPFSGGFDSLTQIPETETEEKEKAKPSNTGGTSFCVVGKGRGDQQGPDVCGTNTNAVPPKKKRHRLHD